MTDRCKEGVEYQTIDGYTGKKVKELVHSGVHGWHHVWTKYFSKTRYEEVKPTMVEF